MNWYYSESKNRPRTIDTASSQKWVYIRRNISKCEREDEFHPEIKEEFYSYEEMKIPKDVYSIFEKEMDNSDRLDDVEEVIVEILGGE